MTDEQKLASDILFDIVSTLEPRVRPLGPWYHSLIETIDKWYRSEGNQGVKRAKDCLSNAWLTICGESIEPLAFVKAENSVPAIVQPLVSRVSKLSKDARLMSAVLSIVRITDLWLGRLQDSTVLNQLRVIEDSKIPANASKVIEEFSEFLGLFLEAYPDHPVVKAWTKGILITEKDFARFSSKSGPNGRLVDNAHKDLKSCMESTISGGGNLFSAIYQLEDNLCKVSTSPQGVGAGDLLKFRNSLLAWEGYDLLQSAQCPGKINLKLEKSGKVRLVASPDYWTQSALHPLFEWCKGVLYSFEADCTKDQRGAIPKICAWHTENREVYSFDQSSCTDLFPFDFQLTLLNHRFGEPVTESVKTVMSDRDWSLKLPSGITKKVRWSVGQPMGVYASWHLMAMAHHFLVQYCYWKSSGRTFRKGGPFNDYVICGDDIVIGSRSVADLYLKTVHQLGMKVNRGKSHISGGTTGIPPISEFAKMTFWKAIPLFPIRPNMVLSSVRDWRQVPTLLADIVRANGFKANLRKVALFVGKHFPKGRRFLKPLLTIPQEFGGVGFRGSDSLKKRFTSVNARELHPWLWYLAQRIRHGLLLEERSVYAVSEALIELPLSIYRQHPATICREQWIKQLGLKVKASDVPTTMQICMELLWQGFGPYDRFLCLDSGEIPPHLRTSNDVMFQRHCWERALERPHYLPTDYDYAGLLSHRFPSDSEVLLAIAQEGTGADQSIDSSAICLERFQELQLSIVQGAMLAVRSNRRQSEN